MKSTESLEEYLKGASFEDINKINKESYSSLSDFLLRYIGERGLSQADIIRASTLNRDYANGIFNGNKTNPSRDRLLALCFACKMTRKEIDTTLKIAKLSPLYPKDQRDQILIICSNKKIYDIDVINDYLFKYNFQSLRTSK